jgi:hypothetical protein
MGMHTKQRLTKRRIALIQLKQSLNLLEVGDPVSALTLVGSLGWDFLLFSYPLSEKGGGCNRTRKLYRSEPDTLCFKAYYNLFLQGFKQYFRPPVQSLLIAPSLPLYSSSGVTLGEELGETFSNV